MEHLTVSRIFLTCRASSAIGLGHFRRCRVLAHAVRSLGGSATWLLDEETLQFLEPDWDHSFEVEELTSTAPEQVAAQIRSKINQSGLAVVDWYPWAEAFDQVTGVRWMRFDQGTGTQSTTAAFLHCALPGISPDHFRSRGLSADARLLLGPQFALLDPVYHDLRASVSPAARPVDRIAVTFGGGDDRGATLYALQEARAACPGMKLEVASTSRNPSLERIISYASEHPRVSVHVDQPCLADLLVDASLAISAGGTTLNELACLGVPTIVLPIAGNQVRPSRLWQEAGFVETLPLGCRKAGAMEILIKKVVRDQNRLGKMSESGRSAVDGLGACRTSKAMLGDNLIS